MSERERERGRARNRGPKCFTLSRSCAFKKNIYIVELWPQLSNHLTFYWKGLRGASELKSRTFKKGEKKRKDKVADFSIGQSAILTCQIIN